MPFPVLESGVLVSCRHLLTQVAIMYAIVFSVRSSWLILQKIFIRYYKTNFFSSFILSHAELEAQC